MTKPPDVSIVVPARNAAAVIPRLFAALDRTTFEGEWEAIVADNASTDGTPELAEAWGARVIRLDNTGGPGAGRNAGAAAARAPLVAFTDADCEPCPEWLTRMTAALAEADIATGAVLPARRPSHAFERSVWVRRESPLFESANLAVRRELLEKVGGFEPFLHRSGAAGGLRPTIDEAPFGEDAVFGWRAIRAGARRRFVDDAVVRHAVFPRGPRGYVAECWRLRFFPALVREIPELRDHLPLRFFLTKESALFDLAVASTVAAVSTRQPLAAVGALPYLRRRMRLRGGWRSVSRHNAGLAAGDLVALVALVRGSIAARRLLV